MKFFGIIFLAPKPVYQSPKPLGYGPDCENVLRDGNKAFCLPFFKKSLTNILKF